MLRIIFASLFICQLSQAQDIFDQKNTENYSKHLMESGQYKLAAKEYERLVFFKNDDDSYKTELFKAYRLSNQASIGISKGIQLYNDPLLMPKAPAFEYTKLLISSNKWDDASVFWTNNKNFKKEDAAVLESTKMIFENNIKGAKSYITTLQYPDNQILKDYKLILDKPQKSKSPALAGIFSIIIPGTGKIYAKDWKDGLVSLVFTASMGIQAYRNFNKFGINNYRPWIYTAIGSGFYLGNIYGSVQSAKKFNIKQNNKIQHEVSDIFNAAY